MRGCTAVPPCMLTSLSAADGSLRRRWEAVPGRVESWPSCLFRCADHLARSLPTTTPHPSPIDHDEALARARSPRRLQIAGGARLARRQAQPGRPPGRGRPARPVQGAPARLSLISSLRPSLTRVPHTRFLILPLPFDRAAPPAAPSSSARRSTSARPTCATRSGCARPGSLWQPTCADADADAVPQASTLDKRDAAVLEERADEAPHSKTSKVGRPSLVAAPARRHSGLTRALHPRAARLRREAVRVPLSLCSIFCDWLNPLSLDSRAGARTSLRPRTARSSRRSRASPASPAWRSSR